MVVISGGGFAGKLKKEVARRMDHKEHFVYAAVKVAMTVVSTVWKTKRLSVTNWLYRNSWTYLDVGLTAFPDSKMV